MTTSALLVVDMQNGFCRPGGSVAKLGMAVEGADGAIDAAATAVRNARRAGIPVVFTRHVYSAGHPELGRGMASYREAVVRQNALVRGTWDAAVVDELGHTPADPTIDKSRLDAFLWTGLHPLLDGLGVDHLWVAGVLTNMCVESTVRSAFMRDLRVSLITDACAATSARLHAIGVEVMTECGFATPATPDDVTA